MPDTQKLVLGEDIKISIIMHEYDTLRNEILLKYSTSVQLITQTFVVLVALLGALVILLQATTILTTKTLFMTSLSLTGAAAILVLISIVWLDYDTKRASGRLREIESQVNDRAGERLLLWETQYGWGGTFRKVR
jgi:protein-S-isoprenylcysteine O-methyltransferase Ste14